MNKKPFTKKEEKEIERLLKESEHKTAFVCHICKTNLTGMKSVREHVDEAKHYEYINPKHPTLRLAVG